MVDRKKIFQVDWLDKEENPLTLSKTFDGSALQLKFGSVSSRVFTKEDLLDFIGAVEEYLDQ